MTVEPRYEHRCSSGCCSPNIKPFFKGGIITAFEGRTKSYAIETIRSGSKYGLVRRTITGYSATSDNSDLVEVVDNLYRRIYPERVRKNPDLTTTRVLKSLSHPRTILELVLHEGVPVGFGIFPRFDINGELVLYSSRAILSEHVREGLGTNLLERAIELHKRESAKSQGVLGNGMLMTQRWESIRSLERLKENGVIGEIQPIGEPFDDLGKDILYGIHSRVWVASQAIDENGLSRGELSEVGRNENAEVPQEGTKGWLIQQKMVLHPPKGAGMNPLAGDVLYVRFTLPESQSAREVDHPLSEAA